MTELACDPQSLKYLLSEPWPKQLANLCSTLKTQIPFSVVFRATRRTRILQAYFSGVNRKSTHEKSGLIVADTMFEWAKYEDLEKKDF